VWTRVRAGAGWQVVHLVNFSGLGMQAQWNEAQNEPTRRSNVPLAIAAAMRPERVFWASADSQPDLAPLDFHWQDGKLVLELPELRFWSLLAIQ
jgi:hypothetical protein